jgi:predicted enzyme related to lactoylglutathione lyase
MSHGKFVWHDLITQDPGKARAFYTGLFGWTAADVPGHEGTFSLFQTGGRNVAGLVTMEPGATYPAHWMPYVSVEKLDEATARAEALGARVLAGPLEAKDAGRWSVLRDPRGGVFSAFETDLPAPAEGELPPVGSFCWEELHSTEPAASLRFYTELFGWKTQTMELEPLGTYTGIAAGSTQLGGVLYATDCPDSYWLSYVHVPDVDAAARKAEALGGHVVTAPTQLPNIGRFAVVADPGGATFALYKSVFG